MNEALETAYTFFTEQGYTGSIEDFVDLISKNSDALDLSYTLFTEEGYAGSFEDFSTLMGVGDTQKKNRFGFRIGNWYFSAQRIIKKPTSKCNSYC